MTSTRLRAAAAILVASAALLALTSCAPAATSASGSPTAGVANSSGSRARHTSKPVALVQPKSRYQFGCGDLISAGAIATLYTVPTTAFETTVRG